MFSNRLVKLFTLKNRFLITTKVLHSIRMFLTVQVVWQVEHCGCGSCFKMKEWVSLVWPIRNRDITTCSLDFLDAGLHSPKVGWIWKSLLCMLLLHCCCYFVWRNLLIVDKVMWIPSITQSTCIHDYKMLVFLFHSVYTLAQIVWSLNHLLTSRGCDFGVKPQVQIMYSMTHCIILSSVKVFIKSNQRYHFRSAVPSFSINGIWM